jgi:hypothetical protein
VQKSGIEACRDREQKLVEASQSTPTFTIAETRFGKR